MTKKKAAIAVDTWKVKQFKKALEKEGYEYRESTLSEDVKILNVEVDEKEMGKLERFIRVTNHSIKSMN